MPLWGQLPGEHHPGPLAQKAESRASRSGTAPSPPPSRGGGDLVLSLSSGLALLSLSPSPSQLVVGHQISRPAAQHPLWAGLRRRRQKAEQADRGLPPPSGGRGGDLVLSLSSGLALLLSRSPSRLLVGSSATKFSRPAAQHPAPIFGWPAAQKRQKAE